MRMLANSSLMQWTVVASIQELIPVQFSSEDVGPKKEFLPPRFEFLRFRALFWFKRARGFGGKIELEEDWNGMDPKVHGNLLG